MNLIIDIGNTLTKLAVFDGEQLVYVRSGEGIDNELFDAYSIDKAIVASVGGDISQLAERLAPNVDFLLEFTPQTKVPINNAYLTPETLGADRIAAAVGANTLYPASNVLIIDFGTAITIDLVTADNTYRGGVISPGMNTRFRSLHDYTARLPLCEGSESEELQGRTTREAIEQGVMNGITYEIEGYISRMRDKFDNLHVIFTGGDAKFFAKRIKNTIFVDYNLLFCGLNRILEYNAGE